MASGSTHSRSPAESSPSDSFNTVMWLWVVTGLTLLGLHVALYAVSDRFALGKTVLEKPVVLLVTLELCACAVWLTAVSLARAPVSGRACALLIVGIGLAMRMFMLFSVPMLETDYYRYLWDGGVLANGLNPYCVVPRDADPGAAGLCCGLRSLAYDGAETLKHISYPHLRTIYPPIAQLFFAISFAIKPWSLLAWRFILLLFDATVLVLLWIVLREHGKSVAWTVIYWWNPLVIKEIVNSAHMDVLVLPMAVGTVLLLTRRRYYLSAMLLACAVGTKIWPVMLLPLVLAPLYRDPRRLLFTTVLFLGLCAALFVPVILSGLDDSSGFTAYGKTWEMNDALYLLIYWVTDFVTSHVSAVTASTHIIARMIVFTVLCSFILWIVWPTRGREPDSESVWENALWIAAAVFLLSPTQFPWYYLWVIPFLTIRPRASLLLMSALVMLYYLRFHFSFRDSVSMFDNGIVFIEYVPVWLLLIWERISAARGRTVLGFG